jgi:amidase
MPVAPESLPFRDVRSGARHPTAIEKSGRAVARSAWCAGMLLVLSLRTAPPAAPFGFSPPRYSVAEKSIAQLQTDLARGTVTAQALTRAYLARIQALDVHGPALRSVIALNPHALADARRSDRARAAGARLGPLAGIPVLIKDNIESGDGTATTAGSEALARNVTRRNAPLVKRLIDAGAIVLGKTNLSEWANFRSSNSISGWSAVGGLVKNPYSLDRSACGSSSGTGAAVAASLAAAGVGTETDGSVTCPASVNGLVGLKPTVGLVSRTYVVPISHDQDTPGPMGRSVADVAALLNAIAGSDPKDAATRDADRHKSDYLAGLPAASLRGKRLGVLRYAADVASPPVSAAFAGAVALLRAQGAQIVELPDFKPNVSALGELELTVLLTDLKTDLNAYLAATPAGVTTRTVADLIAFDRADPRELRLFGQDLFEKAEATKGPSDPHYRNARDAARRRTGPEGIDRLVTGNHLDALIAPTYAPASRIDVVDGDDISGVVASLPAMAGYPHLTVPMGAVRGLPVGLSFIGRAWTERSLLELGAAYERAAHERQPPAYVKSLEDAGTVTGLFAPNHR